MNRLNKYFVFLLLLFLTFSCSAKRECAVKQHPPVQTIENKKYIDHEISKKIKDFSNPRKIIVQHAIKNLGLPYKWGGTTPGQGFDCSGLIVYTHHKADITIPRTAKAQFNNGKVITKKNLQAADLIFFQIPGNDKSVHVGIYIGDQIFIHAPGQGRQVAYGYINNPYFEKNYLGSRSYL